MYKYFRHMGFVFSFFQQQVSYSYCGESLSLFFFSSDSYAQVYEMVNIHIYLHLINFQYNFMKSINFLQSVCKKKCVYLLKAQRLLGQIKIKFTIYVRYKCTCTCIAKLYLNTRLTACISCRHMYIVIRFFFKW